MQASHRDPRQTSGPGLTGIQLHSTATISTYVVPGGADASKAFPRTSDASARVPTRGHNAIAMWQIPSSTTTTDLG